MEQKQVQRNEQEHRAENNSGKVGNHTQEHFAEVVPCPECGVETRVTTPSVGLSTCDNDDCGVRAFVLERTEEEKYG